MDVNGTRFFIFLGEDDWYGNVKKPNGKVKQTNLISGDSSRPDLIWDETYASLTLKPLVFRFPRPPGDRLLEPKHRRGAGRDGYGNWYWIDESEEEIRFLASDGYASEHFWASKDLNKICQCNNTSFQSVSAPSTQVLKLRGLAVTTNHYLIVGVIQPAGILIFDLHAGGSPIQMLWPSEVKFEPFDISPAYDGSVWILDRENSRYWKLDKYFRVVTEDQKEQIFEEATKSCFQPEVQKPKRAFPAGIFLLPNIAKPLSIEGLPDDTVLILESNSELKYSKIHRYHFGKALGTVSLEAVLKGLLDTEDDAKNPDGIRGHDIAFLPDKSSKADKVTGTLYMVDVDGNQAFAFDFKDTDKSFKLALLSKYLPLRLFSGRGLVSGRDAIYYDLQDRWLPVIAQPILRYKEKGVLETHPFDGKEVDCVWHRLFLDAWIPSGSEVLVESKAANEEDYLDQISWQAEPRLYCRRDGPEIPYYQAFTANEIPMDGAGTWELLFQHAKGRYLKLRLTLQGTGHNTPRLRSLRVYYPRFSYLQQYMPAVYQEDKNSASFLERYLANMEGIYAELEGKIEKVQVLFDSQNIAAEYLDWLAGWLGVIFEPSWNEAKRRLFLAHTIDIFNKHGTVAGLKLAVRFAIDPCPDETIFEESLQTDRNSVRIIERYLTRRASGVVYGDPNDLEIPSLTANTNEWTPAHGAERIHRCYREYLEECYSIEELNKLWDTEYTGFDEILFSPVPPENSVKVWEQFAKRSLGFTYETVLPEDEPIYRTFLMSRYKRISSLNNAYQTNFSSFEEIKLPKTDLPQGGKRLYDWVQFVSLLLPISREAHRFTVLIPANPDDDFSVQQQKLDLVRRVIELEKPAHTRFDVKSYWAVFRVAEARLGIDTVLGKGSRYVALILGKNSLLYSFLKPPHPWGIEGRTVIGRDSPGGMKL